MMHEWYLPITILPGLGMLILSTATQMMGLSGEINMLLSKKCSSFEHQISAKKIKQLSRLTRASTLLYIAAGLYVLSGIWGLLEVQLNVQNTSQFILYIGTILVFIALTLLSIYAYHTVKIRKLQHQHNLHMTHKL